MSGEIPIRANMVAAFLLDKELPGKTLLLRRNLDDAYAPGGYQILYGHIEVGELPEGTLLREIAEETGLEVVSLYSLNETFVFYEKVSRTIRLTPVFVAYLNTSTPLRLDPKEHCAAEWFSFEEASSLLPWPAQRNALQLLQSLLANNGTLSEIMQLKIPR